MIPRSRFGLAAAALLLTAAATLQLVATPSQAAGSVGDPVRGKTVFARCAMCHAMQPGRNGLGPSLAGIIGRKAGTVAGYKYSPAMAASGKVWAPSAIDTFITNPRTFLPGNKMVFPGIANSRDRADLIAYLGQAKK